MPLITENGWPQISADQLDKSRVEGLDIPFETAPGDAGLILRAFAIWFDRNVEDLEHNHERDEWWWSRTNSVWNSNHLSGTAGDFNATLHPMGVFTFEQAKVDKTKEGIRLFEGTIFWGRDWNTPDEMHFQIWGTPETIAPFAQKLRDGYLGLFEPEVVDPNAWPLPKGYAYGPLEGPGWCVSGEWKGDSEKAKAGIRRLQELLGFEQTGVWRYGEPLCNAMVQLQNERGWPPAGDLGQGLVFEGEWNEVIAGWKPGGEPPPPIDEMDVFGVYWADVSVYQDDPGTPQHDPVDESYPYRIFCFRVCTGNQIDPMAVENYREAKRLADKGELYGIMPYAFWRPQPDHDTTGTFIRFLQEQGLHPKLLSMCDVEDGTGSALGGVTGDQSVGANDFLDRCANELHGGDRRRLFGYHNFRANPNMWLSLPPDLKMIRPNYSLPPGQGKPDGPQFFAHQYSSAEEVPPWEGDDTDMNFYQGTLRSFLEACGLLDEPKPPEPEPEPVPEPEPEVRVIELAAGQTLRIVRADD